MAYNNYFPAGYQPYQNYPMQNNAYQQMNTQQQQIQNGIIWVQGEAAAKSYPVAPNSSVALYYEKRFGAKIGHFEIQTTSYGSLPSEEIDKVIAGYKEAQEVAALAEKLAQAEA